MSKRKYTRSGETPTSYQCTKAKCKWEGSQIEKEEEMENGWLVHVCPKCGNDEFYGLL